MQIKQKKSNKVPPLAIIVFVALLLASSLVAYAFSKKIGPFAPDIPKSPATINYDPATEEEKSTGNSIKENISNGSTGSDPLPAPTPSTDGSKPTVGVKITAVVQNGAMLNIRTLIQTVSSTGTCKLTMTGPSGKTYTATANIQAGPSSSTCKGFDVLTSSLSPGAWEANIVFENDSIEGSDKMKGIVVQ